jgi:hypothetical protein
MALIILLTVSGCGNDADRDSTAGDSRATAPPNSSASDEVSQDAEASSEGTQSVADPKARKALRSAIVRLLRANTGHFEVTVPFGSDSGSRERGQYQVRPVAYDGVRELTTPEGTVRFAYRGVGDEIWLRLESATSDEGRTPPWPCWVNYDDIADMPEFPIELASGPNGQPPSAIVAASYGVGQRVVDAHSIEGTMDLALALGLVSGKLLVASGIDAQGDDTAPATFSLDGQTLSGFTVPLADLPDAIEGAGGDLPPELESLAALPGGITTRFSDFGVPVNVQAPPAAERLTFMNADDIESAMRSCGGG